MSLMEALETAPIDEGLRLEAALDYYESLRMARIINHTRTDTRSLNIDLDDFMHNYQDTIHKIVNLLQLDITSNEKEALIQELGFYDVTNSQLYRWSMSNPFTSINHVNTGRSHNELEMMMKLKSDELIMKMYTPILALMNL